MSTTPIGPDTNIEITPIDIDNPKYTNTKDGGRTIVWIGVGAIVVGGLLGINGGLVSNAKLGGAGVIIAAVGLATSIYFASGKYYKDPKARAEYNQDLTKGKMSLQRFVEKYGWGNIKTYGFAKKHSPLATQAQMEKVFFSRAKELQSCMNLNQISVEATCTYKKVKGPLWEYLSNGMFTNQGIEKLHKQFGKEFDEYKASFLFANLRELKKNDFNRYSSLQPYFNWLEKNDDLYQQIVRNFGVREQQLRKGKGQDIELAKTKAENKNLKKQNAAQYLQLIDKDINISERAQKKDAKRIHEGFKQEEVRIKERFQTQLNKLVFDFHKDLGNLDTQYEVFKTQISLQKPAVMPQDASYPDLF